MTQWRWLPETRNSTKLSQKSFLCWHFPCYSSTLIILELFTSYIFSGTNTRKKKIEAWIPTTLITKPQKEIQKTKIETLKKFLSFFLSNQKFHKKKQKPTKHKKVPLGREPWRRWSSARSFPTHVCLSRRLGFFWRLCLFFLHCHEKNKILYKYISWSDFWYLNGSWEEEWGCRLLLKLWGWPEAFCCCQFLFFWNKRKQKKECFFVT